MCTTKIAFKYNHCIARPGLNPASDQSCILQKLSPYNFQGFWPWLLANSPRNGRRGASCWVGEGVQRWQPARHSSGLYSQKPLTSLAIIS